MSAAADEPINPFEHVVDSDHIHIFDSLPTDIPLGGMYKFMIMEAMAALLIIGAFVWLARQLRSGEPPRGRLVNFLEMILVFIRDQVARPSIGHDGDKFLPFLWTLFLFIWVCNLLGAVPFLASPTASIAVTGTLALCSFIVIHTMGIAINGPVGYLRSFVPNIHLEGGLFMQLFATVLVVGMSILEVFTAFVRAFVLAVRLFANMLAGHTVLFVLLLFIRMVGEAADPTLSGGVGDPLAGWLYWPITFSSVALVTALGLLELFVASLQAFVFTFLTAVFIGLAMHPQH